MKKVICLCASALLLGSGSMFAQGEMDAYKFSQYDLNGTARYLSMGGAFGALGGDISAMRTQCAPLWCEMTKNNCERHLLILMQTAAGEQGIIPDGQGKNGGARQKTSWLFAIPM